MLKQKIKCHKVGDNYSKEHFFILSKGNNAGKPLNEPCTNCYVFLADTKEERSEFFYLLYGLWQLGLPRRQLVGSVIPFIRINDLCNIVTKATENVNKLETGFSNYVEYLNQLEDQVNRLKKQIDLTIQLKQAVLFKLIG